MCHLDMARESEVRETLEGMLFSKMEEMEEMEELQAAHVSLSRKYDSTVSSHRFAEGKYLMVSQDFFKQVKTIKALRVEGEELRSMLQQQRQELSRVWQVRDEAWRHGFLSGREALRVYLLPNPGCELLLLDPEFPASDPTTLEARAWIGMDLVPSTFTNVPEAPVAVRTPPEVHPVESKKQT